MSPVFDQGYRPYEGRRRGRALRWWPIGRTVLRTARRWPLVLTLVAGAFPLVIKLVQAYVAGAGSALFPGFPAEWGFGDGLFFELISWEIFWVVLLLMVVGSGQIADDLRTGALQIYFSRPITHLDYVLGKLGGVVLAGSLLTVLPAVILLIAVALFAPDWTWLSGNPWLPLRVLGFALLVSVVLGAAVLGLSSLGRRGRLVGIVFAGGYFFTMILARILPEVFRDRRWEVVHLGTCLDAAGRSLFAGGPLVAAPAGVAWGILGALFLLSLGLLARKLRTVEVVS